jgi:hypothetical protein
MSEVIVPDWEKLVKDLDEQIATAREWAQEIRTVRVEKLALQNALGDILEEIGKVKEPVSIPKIIKIISTALKLEKLT